MQARPSSTNGGSRPVKCRATYWCQPSWAATAAVACGVPPIGSARGLINKDALKTLRAYFPDTPLIIDAGIGAPSHAAEAILDAANVPDVPYALEVESPGLDRKLYTLADCRRFAGRRVTVQLLRKVEGAAKLKGILENVEGEALTILDEDQRRRYTVQFGDVKLARLVPEP